MTIPVAVVGMDCRLPGAPDLAAFHRLLLEGRTVAGPVPDDRWGPDDESPAGTHSPGGFLDDAASFDHGFFGIAPAEAAAMDPQQRLLLQTTWRAVEDSGVSPRALAGTETSVHVGVMSSEWGTLHLADHRAMTAHRGSGNGYCMAANRLSYHLDLKGPSLAVDSACSSSLVAVHLAATALRAGEVDTAIAAGVNLILTPALSVFYASAGLAAADGRCKPFAAAADGIGRGEGVGVVVLRRLDDALRDGQPVHAVIDGGAVGSDGRSNGLTAPNRFAQAEVIRRAHRSGGISADDVAFVEGHGTGTKLGDMIEVRALGDVHGGRQAPMLLGSVKANLGHLEGAAGITGLIKACLALEHRVLPPTPGGPENPELRLAEHGLRLAAAPVRLPSGTLRAGVSSFGLGGTNAHLVLSSPPPRRTPAGSPDDAVVLVSGGASRHSLQAGLRELAAAVRAEPPARRGRIAWTTTQVRTGHRHRFAVAATVEGLPAALDTALAALDGAPEPERPRTPSIALTFTGQGSPYPGMAVPLYRHCPPFRAHLDAASEAVGAVGGATVTGLLLGGADLTPTAVAQPALFAVGYALAATLRDAGVHPRVLLGHSVGEFAAACLAGVFTLEEAGGLVAARGALMQALPTGGAMLSVRADEPRIREILGAAMPDVAALNGPQATVLSGDGEALTKAADALTAAGLRCTPLAVSHAFHSRLMAPVVEEFRERAGAVPARPLQVPLASTVRGALLPAGTVLDADYWADQLCAPVRFTEAAAHLADPTHVVEAGPRPVLLGLLRQAGVATGTGLACVPGPNADGTELAEVLAALHHDGLDPDWSALFAPAHRVLHRIPGYVFDTRNRFWFAANGNTDALAAGTPPPPLQSARPAVETPTPDIPASDVPALVATDAAAAVLTALSEVSGHATGALVPHARLDDDLGFDSVMAMRLADELEPRLGEPLDVEALLPHLTTVASLIDHLETRLGGPAGEGVPA
jgi:acyl transferase domain-containing protein